MVVYGVALLAICMLIGVFLGDMLGQILNVEANVGGVGIAMLMLVLVIDQLKKKDKLNQKSQDGLTFWSSMYIPIVVAMAAQQNVAGALEGGPMAIIAGVLSVLACFALVPVLSKIGKDKSEEFFENNEIDKAN
ncbi:malonate transporter, MadL subunit [Alteribacillus persepolensis]|uniref:Malonate transporter, MadL subunit n=1 Tax=Alteribacillus persepolensis TaxID=568899 RepID=A0A1G8EAU8_9BACI|nr:malonate transporter subunit MadL [Alteribacillus persepolensis]SDH67038.1 malonate transporter, MadL subunit [Alteribacillus persepolensis]